MIGWLMFAEWLLGLITLFFFNYNPALLFLVATNMGLCLAMRDLWEYEK